MSPIHWKLMQGGVVSLFLVASACGQEPTPRDQPRSSQESEADTLTARIDAMKADISRLEKERDEARQAAAEERQRREEDARTQQDRDAFDRDVRARLDEIDASIRTLREKANRGFSQERAKMEKALQDADAERDRIEHELRTLRTQTDEGLARIKKDISRSLDDLSTSVRSAIDKKK